MPTTVRGWVIGTLCGNVEQNRAKLDHLEFDVGIDYRMDGDKLTVLKSGYYGTF